MTNLQIAKLYVAVNGTAPTAAELTTLSADANAAATIMAMVDFTGADNTATLNAAYQAAFGRDADAEGLAYWGAELTAGNVTGSTLMEKLLVGADVYVSAGDATIAALNTADKGITANKATVAVEIATAGLTATEAATALALVTATDTAAASASVVAVVDAAAALAAEEAAAAAAVGSTVVFTTAIDTLSGTTGNDTFVGDVQSTSSSADQIAGNSGTDTIKLYTTGAITLPVMSSIESLYVNGLDAAINISALTDVTSLEIDDFSASTANAAIGTNITVAAGQSIKISNTAAVVEDTDGVVDIAGAASITSLDIETYGSGTTTAITYDIDTTGVKTVNLTSSGDGTASDNNSVIVTETAATTLSTVSLDGAQKMTLDLQASVATLATFDASNATGATVVTLGNNALATGVTVNGGAGNDIIHAVGDVNYTVDMGAGDDTFNAAFDIGGGGVAATELGTLTVNDTIDGGAGTDAIGMTQAQAMALDGGSVAEKAILAKITNFETLSITDDTNAAEIAVGTMGYNNFETTIVFTTADAMVTGLTSGATYTRSQIGDDTTETSLLISMTGATAAATPNDTLNINLASNLTAAEVYTVSTGVGALHATNALELVALAAPGVNVFNINATDSNNSDAATNHTMGYTLELDDTDGNAASGANTAYGDSSNLNTINITGTQAVQYTVEAVTTGLEVIDASASTGVITIDADAFVGTEGVSITGGSRDDALVGSDLADIIVGGAGNDNIEGGKGADTLTGGAGVDTFYYASQTGTSTSETGGIPSATTFDTITDFSTTDKLALTLDNGTTNVAITIVQSGTMVAGNAMINAEGIATFAASDDTLQEKIDAVETAIEAGTEADGAIAIFEHDTDSYVFMYSNDNGGAAGVDILDTADLLIKLAGVTGLTDSTLDANGDIAIA